MGEKIRRERNELPPSLGYWLMLYRASQREELESNYPALDNGETQGQQRRLRLKRTRDQGLEP